MLGLTKWMSIPDPPEGWTGFVERLAKSRGASRLAEWWRSWILEIDSKTYPADDDEYESVLHLGLGIASYAEPLFEHPSWSHEMLAHKDEQQELIQRVLAHLEEAQKASEGVRLLWPDAGRSKKARIRSQNPVYFAIVDVRTMLEDRALLLGYIKPRDVVTIGRRGRAAADSQAAGRGYAVRGLAQFMRPVPAAIREAFITNVLECAGQGTSATRQNVQAILRAARRL